MPIRMNSYKCNLCDVKQTKKCTFDEIYQSSQDFLFNCNRGISEAVSD